MKGNNYTNNLSLNEKVLMAIVRAAEIFKRAHAVVFRSYGLSLPQYNVLRVLEASEKGRNKISRVSRIMLVPGANMTGLAKRLARDGFIVRKSDPGDERVTVLELTPKGKRTLRNIEKEKDRWLEVILKGVSKEEKSELLGRVKQLIKNNMQGVETFVLTQEIGGEGRGEGREPDIGENRMQNQSLFVSSRLSRGKKPLMRDASRLLP